jgi:uncharacterized protein YdeI (YjbR/CyaY-like superfamily)
MQLGDQLCAVVVAAGFAGGEKDGRIGRGADGTSVDFSWRECMAVKRFRAVLERLAGGLAWTVARVPFDVGTTWKKMVKLRVKVETGGEMFRTSLFPDGTHGGHFVLVNKKMQKAAGVKLGGMITLAVEPDLDEREAEVPPELAKLFKENKALAKWYRTLSLSAQREIAWHVGDVKSVATRQRRAEQMAERLMLTMESEKQLPPILEVAFHRTPEARKGWDAMTLVQRRGHLFGVFYYRTPEGRQRRVDRLVEAAVRVARGEAGKDAEDEAED